MEYIKPSYCLYVSVAGALLGSFQYGLLVPQLNAINYNTDCKTSESLCIIFPGHSTIQWSFATNLWVLGGAIGALSCGIPNNKLGRKKTLFLNSIVMIIGGILQTAAPHIWVLAIGRLFSGIASGIATTVAGCYIAEIAPTHIRGSLGTWLQMSLVIGILLGNIVIFPFGNKQLWRVTMSLPIFLGIFQILVYHFMVESPRWLVSKKRMDLAKKELHRLFPTANNIDPMLEDFMANRNSGETSPILLPVPLEDNLLPSKGSTSSFSSKKINRNTSDGHSILSIDNVFKNKDICIKYSRQLVVAIGLSIFQQLSGINAVFYYSSTFFNKAGVRDIRVGNTITATINVIATFLALLIMNKVGRRDLFLFSSIGMFFSALSMTICLVYKEAITSIISTCFYVTFFEFGLGPIPWIITSEIFPEHLRAYANSLATFFNWSANLVVGISYPYIAESIKEWSFIPFVFILFLAIIFVLILVPETRNKTLEEIQNELYSQNENALGDHTFRARDSEEKVIDDNSTGHTENIIRI